MPDFHAIAPDSLLEQRTERVRVLRAGRRLIIGESTASAEGHLATRATATKSKLDVGG